MKYIIILFILFLFGCKEKKVSGFYEIVNSNFITITDTVAYKYGKFIPTPNDTLFKIINPKKKIIVLVDTNFRTSKALSTSLLANLNEKKLLDFTKLLNNDNSLKKIDLSKIIKTGKYTLIASGETEKIDTAIAGQLTFFNPYISEDKAVITISIKSSQKAGKATAYLFNRIKENWVLKEKIELERW